MRFTCSVLCVGVVLGLKADTTPDVTATIIEREVYYERPIASCDVPAIVRRIVRAADIPAGIERSPDCIVPAPSRASESMEARERIYLTGKSVGAALNELVAADPRFQWSNANGVVVIRPVTAWANPHHFLHRTLDSFSVIDQHMGGAFQEWRRAMASEERADESYSQRTSEGNRRFTVTSEAHPTAIAALDHIVRAHGRLLWELTYCQPATEARFATVMLWTTEDDPSGLGAPMRERFGRVNGRTVDACVASPPAPLAFPL